MNKLIKKIIIFIIIIMYLVDYNDIDLSLNIKRLKEINKDIIGVIYYCNREDIVLQSYDNKYYMYHNYLGNNSYSGEIFLDYRNNINDNILIIYGHNSSLDITSFSILKEYLNEVYYDNNKYIKIRFIDRINTYIIYSIFIEDNNYSYLNINGNQEHYIYLKNKSIYESDIDLNDNDKILILQTCYGKRGSYLVIVSKLVKEDYYDNR